MPYAQPLMAGYLLDTGSSFAITCRIRRLQRPNGGCVIKSNTLLRVVYSLGVYFILSQSAVAQSVLNFARTTVNDQFNAGVAVTNPTSQYADVVFTFYGLDGNPISSGLINPVSYRISPKGQISMLASDIFGGSKVDGWVQATSAASGLIGFYLSGDFTSEVEDMEAAAALTTQVIPAFRDDSANRTEIVILNPGAGTSNVTVNFFGMRGEEAGTVVRSLAPHAAFKLRPSALVANPSAGSFSARISSSTPVAATAVVQRDSGLMFAAGQATDQPASVRVAPHFTSGNGFDPVIALTNPNTSAVTVTVTVFSETGGPVYPSLTTPSSRNFVIPPNGSIFADVRTIVGLLFAPSINGWARIDSPSVVLNGYLILDQGPTATSIPFQTNPTDRMIFSQSVGTQSLFTGLILTNPSGLASAVDLSLVREDGTIFAQTTTNIPATRKFSALLRDIFRRQQVRRAAICS